MRTADRTGNSIEAPPAKRHKSSQDDGRTSPLETGPGSAVDDKVSGEDGEAQLVELRSKLQRLVVNRNKLALQVETAKALLTPEQQRELAFIRDGVTPPPVSSAGEPSPSSVTADSRQMQTVSNGGTCIIIDDDLVITHESRPSTTVVISPGGKEVVVINDNSPSPTHAGSGASPASQSISPGSKHVRADCPSHRFRRMQSAMSGPVSNNATFCSYCECYICDRPASQCKDWKLSSGAHCNAHAASEQWKKVRWKAYKARPLDVDSFVELLPEDLRAVVQIAAPGLTNFTKRFRTAVFQFFENPTITELHTYEDYYYDSCMEEDHVDCSCCCHDCCDDCDWLSGCDHESGCANCCSTHLKRHHSLRQSRSVLDDALREALCAVKCNRFQEAIFRFTVIAAALMEESMWDRPHDITGDYDDHFSMVHSTVYKMVKVLIRVAAVENPTGRLSALWDRLKEALHNPRFVDRIPRKVMDCIFDTKPWTEEPLQSVLKGKAPEEDFVESLPIVRARVSYLKHQKRFVEAANYLRLVMVDIEHKVDTNEERRKLVCKLPDLLAWTEQIKELMQCLKRPPRFIHLPACGIGNSQLLLYMLPEKRLFRVLSFLEQLQGGTSSTDNVAVIEAATDEEVKKSAGEALLSIVANTFENMSATSFTLSVYGALAKSKRLFAVVCGALDRLCKKELAKPSDELFQDLRKRACDYLSSSKASLQELDRLSVDGIQTELVQLVYLLEILIRGFKDPQYAVFLQNVSSQPCIFKGTPWAAQHLVADCAELAAESSNSFVGSALSFVLSSELGKQGVDIFPMSAWTVWFEKFPRTRLWELVTMMFQPNHCATTVATRKCSGFKAAESEAGRKQQLTVLELLFKRVKKRDKAFLTEDFLVSKLVCKLGPAAVKLGKMEWVIGWIKYTFRSYMYPRNFSALSKALGESHSEKIQECLMEIVNDKLKDDPYSSGGELLEMLITTKAFPKVLDIIKNGEVPPQRGSAVYGKVVDLLQHHLPAARAKQFALDLRSWLLSAVLGLNFTAVKEVTQVSMLTRGKFCREQMVPVIEAFGKAHPAVLVQTLVRAMELVEKVYSTDRVSASDRTWLVTWLTSTRRGFQVTGQIAYFAGCLAAMRNGALRRKPAVLKDLSNHSLIRSLPKASSTCKLLDEDLGILIKPAPPPPAATPPPLPATTPPPQAATSPAASANPQSSTKPVSMPPAGMQTPSCPQVAKPLSSTASCEESLLQPLLPPALPSVLSNPALPSAAVSLGQGSLSQSNSTPENTTTTLPSPSNPQPQTTSAAQGTLPTSAGSHVHTSPAGTSLAAGLMSSQSGTLPTVQSRLPVQGTPTSGDRHVMVAILHTPVGSTQGYLRKNPATGASQFMITQQQAASPFVARCLAALTTSMSQCHIVAVNNSPVAVPTLSVAGHVHAVDQPSAGTVLKSSLLATGAQPIVLNSQPLPGTLGTQLGAFATQHLLPAAGTQSSGAPNSQSLLQAADAQPSASKSPPLSQATGMPTPATSESQAALSVVETYLPSGHSVIETALPDLGVSPGGSPSGHVAAGSPSTLAVREDEAKQTEMQLSATGESMSALNAEGQQGGLSTAGNKTLDQSQNTSLKGGAPDLSNGNETISSLHVKSASELSLEGSASVHSSSDTRSSSSSSGEITVSSVLSNLSKGDYDQSGSPQQLPAGSSQSVDQSEAMDVDLPASMNEAKSGLGCTGSAEEPSFSNVSGSVLAQLVSAEVSKTVRSTASDVAHHSPVTTGVDEATASHGCMLTNETVPGTAGDVAHQCPVSAEVNGATVHYGCILTDESAASQTSSSFTLHATGES